MTTELPEAAAPQPDCPLCRGEGVVFEQTGEFTVAKLCTCIPDCQRCGGSGRVVITTEEGIQTGRCRCQMLPDRAGLFNRAKIPARFHDASLVSFSRGATQVGDDAKFKAFVEVSHWLSQFDPNRENKGLVLHGKVGRGKTHLMVALLRSLVFQHGVEVRFVEFSRLLSLLKEGYSSGRSDTALLGELANVPILGIDELGKGRLTDWELQVIDEVISRRYNCMRTTLGTSNFKPGNITGAEPPNAAQTTAPTQTLGDRVGDRVYSRLKQMTGFVELGGLDFREL